MLCIWCSLSIEQAEGSCRNRFGGESTTSHNRTWVTGPPPASEARSFSCKAPFHGSRRTSAFVSMPQHDCLPQRPLDGLRHKKEWSCADLDRLEVATTDLPPCLVHFIDGIISLEDAVYMMSKVALHITLQFYERLAYSRNSILCFSKANAMSMRLKI